MNIKHLLIGGTMALSALQAPLVFAAAGDTVSNQATVSFQVGGTPQTAIESSPTGNTTPGSGSATTFLEDRFLNFALVTTNATAIPVFPGQDGAAATGPVITFTVTNNGNGCQDFNLAPALVASGAVAIFGGVTDNFDTAGTLTTLVDATFGAAAQTFDGDEPAATFINELCPDTGTNVATVFVYPNGTDSIPITQVNGDIALISLTTEVRVGGAAGLGIALPNNEGDLDVPGTVQNVFATAVDGTEGLTALVGSESLGEREAGSGYVILAAELITTKQSIVTAPGANQDAGTAGDNPKVTTDIALGSLDEEVAAATISFGNPKRIPLAVVSYVIEVQNEDTETLTPADAENADAATATDVYISDDLSALVGTGNPFVDATPTATLITDNGGAETITSAVTPLLSGAFDATTHSAGEIVYLTDTKIIYGFCGDLDGNTVPATPGTGVALDEACRLVIDLTVQ